MAIREYVENRKPGFITRWHARQVLRDESLAEHHYFVARNTLMICRALSHYGIASPNIEDAVTLALSHDDVEQETGDISGSAKRRYPKLRKLMVGVERDIINGLLYEDLPEELGDYYRRLALRVTEFYDEGTDLEVQIVKYADKLEALLFAQTEVALGNSLMNDVAQLIAREVGELEWDWLRSLRQETGLP